MRTSNFSLGKAFRSGKAFPKWKPCLIGKYPLPYKSEAFVEKAKLLLRKLSKVEKYYFINESIQTQMTQNQEIPQILEESLVEGTYQVGLDSEYQRSNYLTFQISIPELNVVAIVISQNLFTLYPEKQGSTPAPRSTMKYSFVKKHLF